MSRPFADELAEKRREMRGSRIHGQPLAPLAISTGDPGGVGPEIALAVALETRHEDPAVLFGDAAALLGRARELGAADACRVLDPDALSVSAGEVGMVDVGAAPAEARQHRATAAGGEAQLRALDAAIAAASSGRARGLVTAPMSKAAVTLAGHDFVGHTEHLARAAGLADDDVTMMFLGPRLRVALVTTHIAIADAPREITPARVLRSVRHLAAALLRILPVRAAGAAPRLCVTGLNPHAGEAGLFGDDEPRAIQPAIDRARLEPPFSDGRLALEGPTPAETAFRVAANGGMAGVVAMLHDQATIASKLLDWGDAVNVTWGLPFVRSSVDHGVAYDAAASGKIEVAGMRAALRMAQLLTRASSG
ncbi:MAG TPA: 4-hydroxythreonine-4-phosphate dehydrogenase PdxA [Polyangiales bacterium]|nr:4-hydroxythreonine-4-phosphate dehydrogenase PdxA [Polyangiales bacterium]